METVMRSDSPFRSLAFWAAPQAGPSRNATSRRRARIAIQAMHLSCRRAIPLALVWDTIFGSTLFRGLWLWADGQSLQSADEDRILERSALCAWRGALPQDVTHPWCRIRRGGLRAACARSAPQRSGLI